MREGDLMSVYLETERLILRDWADGDGKLFAQMNFDPMVMEFMPRRLDEAASNKLVKRFKKHLADYGYGLYAVEVKETKAFIGFVGLEHVPENMPFSPAVEIAWRLSYDAWGHGYASEAAKVVLKYGFDELGLKEIVAFSVYDNDKSLSVMSKIGMEKDPEGDFHYPRLPKGHPLAQHVLYRAKKTP